MLDYSVWNIKLPSLPGSKKKVPNYDRINLVIYILPKYICQNIMPPMCHIMYIFLALLLLETLNLVS